MQSDVGHGHKDLLIALLDEVGFIVAAASTGFTLGTNIMRSRLEPTPDEQLAIIETGGLPP